MQEQLFEIDITPAIPSIVDGVLEEAGESITPYRIAALANRVFEECGFAYYMRPQMAYNYSRNGLIVKGQKRTGSGVTYTKAEVREFLVRFVTRQINR